MFALLTRQLVRNFLKYLRVQLYKSTVSNKKIFLPSFIKHRKITSGLKYACATGNWGIQRGANNQTGVCQVLNQTNAAARISHFRLVNTPLNRDGKQVKPRQLGLSRFGIFCAAETPEGISVGLLNVLCTFTHLRQGYNASHVVNILHQDMKILPVLEPQPLGSTSILVNGLVCGYTRDPEDLVHTLKRYRRWHEIPIDTSIYFDGVSEILIQTDAGDCYAPYLVVSRLNTLKQLMRTYGNYLPYLWDRLLIAGVVEYISKLEEQSCCIANSYAELRPHHTHLQVEKSFMLFGVSAGIIPFSNHNQAPRNIYQSSMGKQAIGVSSLRMHPYLESKAHTLNYVQRPLVTTNLSTSLDLDKEPAGQCAVVAILCYEGFNQEDSVLFNRSALQRGLFRTTTSIVYTDRECSKIQDREEIAKVGKVLGKRKADYDKLDSRGIIQLQTPFTKGDVIIGKTIKQIKYKGPSQVRDRSLVMKYNETYRATKIIESQNDGKFVTVCATSQRQPEIGDKVSSRHGQKGIIGMIYPQEDLPYTVDGIVPDIVMNCHACPSRMTIGQLLESYLGKVSCMKGRPANGTPFRGITVKDIDLLAAPYQLGKQGKEVMFCGKTGKRLKRKVFIGITYYQRLKHMVKDKIHARSTGPMQFLTRQPLEGRARQGGFRMGEMERDNMISHGTAHILQDRLLQQSDEYKTFACTQCGHLAERRVLSKKVSGYCRHCKSTQHTCPITLPYSMKLLIQELAAAHIKLTLDFETATA
jgi:DNA-directed RNA polymerase II subunit RPB2